MSDNAYLFVWNKDNWEIEKLLPIINKVQKIGIASDCWGIASYRKVNVGDRAFLFSTKTKVKGFFASGKIIAKDFKFVNWEGKNKEGVLIEFDIFFNPISDEILNVQNVNALLSTSYKWPTRPSGMPLNNAVFRTLENIWDEFCLKKYPFNNQPVSSQTFNEGTFYQLIQTVYERNPGARKRCLEFYGYSCKVCGCNFADRYGEIGKEFIHVHHINQLSIGKMRETDPIKDLRPVCPNCHAMLHRKNPPYSIEELQSKLK